MVDSQTSPMSSPADNTSRRNSFAGDSFIKMGVVLSPTFITKLILDIKIAENH
ncbi:hypothetical protein DPMN_013967 [Dreissena polymorpha]|uniref:Uncharacterized protein n=1 Tax=Dreissena polymorpha TaxID=45954 RepID=A0A9D4N8V7_DREPO|nr:hypothetical protein DPMN_013967 [Dreissena polymorpha]